MLVFQTRAMLTLEYLTRVIFQYIYTRNMIRGVLRPRLKNIKMSKETIYNPEIPYNDFLY